MFCRIASHHHFSNYINRNSPLVSAPYQTHFAKNRHRIDFVGLFINVRRVKVIAGGYAVFFFNETLSNLLVQLLRREVFKSE